MEPTAISNNDGARLAPHRRLVFARDQPEYRPLPALEFPDPTHPVRTRWVLSAEERAKVTAGEDLYIQVLTFGKPLQPMLPSVGLEDQLPSLGAEDGEV